MNIYTETLNKIKQRHKNNPVKVKIKQKLKYFWKTSKIVDIPNIVNGQVMGTKTLQVPDQGQYIK